MERNALIKWLAIILSVFTAVLVIDLVTKHVFYYMFDTTIIPGVISIQFARNFGIAFGWFQEAGWVLAVISAVLIALAVTWFVLAKLGKIKTHKQSMVFDIGMAFFIGGAVGNLVDRIFFGYVRDFIRFDFVNFPIFNFADIFINVGLILLIIYIFKTMSTRDIIKKDGKTDNQSENLGEQA
ncbi:MAG: signal peptidase II [Firmicutes bacterium]|nr:signal peptidase II [Bacillota bacterium]